MRILLFLPIAFLFMSFTGWQNNFESAKQQAKEEHKLILLNFSGSDWCGPCIMLRKEIFEDASFKVFADSSLVLVNVDFPRQKKNQLPAPQQQINARLADQYNKNGIFPLTLLLSSDGKIIKTWENKPKENVSQFIQLVKEIIVRQ